MGKETVPKPWEENQSLLVFALFFSTMPAVTDGLQGKRTVRIQKMQCGWEVWDKQGRQCERGSGRVRGQHRGGCEVCEGLWGFSLCLWGLLAERKRKIGF